MELTCQAQNLSGLYLYNRNLVVPFQKRNVGKNAVSNGVGWEVGHDHGPFGLLSTFGPDGHVFQGQGGLTDTAKIENMFSAIRSANNKTKPL